MENKKNWLRVRQKIYFRTVTEDQTETGNIAADILGIIEADILENTEVVEVADMNPLAEDAALVEIGKIETG